MIIDEGIILNRLPLQEKKLLLTVFTKNSGVQKFVVKQDKGKSLSPLILIEFSYHEKESNLQTLKSYEIIDTYPHLRKNFNDIQTASYLLKTIQAAHLEGRVEEPLFEGLLFFLKTLPLILCKATALIAFQIKLLEHEGLLPESLPELDTYEHEYLFNLLNAKTLRELNHLKCPQQFEIKWEKLFNDRIV